METKENQTQKNFMNFEESSGQTSAKSKTTKRSKNL